MKAFYLIVALSLIKYYAYQNFKAKSQEAKIGRNRAWKKKSSKKELTNLKPKEKWRNISW